MDHKTAYGYLPLNHQMLYKTTPGGQPVMTWAGYPPIPGQSAHQSVFIPEMTKLGDQLVRLYIDVFCFDPHFAEYMECHKCGRYHSVAEWHDLSFTCSGTSDQPHATCFMDDAWRIDDIKLSWYPKFQDPTITSWVMIHKPSAQVVGFTIGRLWKKESFLKRWPSIADNPIFKGGSNTIAYYDELGVSVAHRGQELGKWLAMQLTTWMKTEHSEMLTVLRTHGDCTARNIYENLGYRQFAGDSEHGQGRIMMWANCRDLTPEDLKFKKLNLDF